MTIYTTSVRSPSKLVVIETDYEVKGMTKEKAIRTLHERLLRTHKRKLGWTEHSVKEKEIKDATDS